MEAGGRRQMRLDLPDSFSDCWALASSRTSTGFEPGRASCCRTRTSLMSAMKVYLGLGNLLLPYATTRSDRERLKHILYISVKSGVTQPAFGDEFIWSREVDLASIRTPVADIDDSLMMSASGTSASSHQTYTIRNEMCINNGAPHHSLSRKAVRDRWEEA